MVAIVLKEMDQYVAQVRQLIKQEHWFLDRGRELFLFKSTAGKKLLQVLLKNHGVLMVRRSGLNDGRYIKCEAHDGNGHR